MCPLAPSFRAFDGYAERYDAWYDSPVGRALLASEVECLRPLLERLPRPYLEIGVGTGRFAGALGIEHGVDPSPLALLRARTRGTEAAMGVAEALPYSGRVFGGVLVAFTLCFMEDPRRALEEVRRVLKPGGGVVLGFLPKGTAWADDYARLGREGHPLYSTARFYARGEVESMLRQAGFRTVEVRSSLFRGPGWETYHIERPVEGWSPEAGFVGIAAVKGEEPLS